MTDVWTIIKHELGNIFWRDRRRAVLLLLASVAYTLLFSWLYLFGVIREVPLLVVDKSNSAFSRHLTKIFDDSDGFRAAAWAENEEEASEWLRRQGRHSAALIIPQDFTEKIQRGRQSEVLLLVEGSNIVITSNSSIVATELVQRFNAECAEQLLERDVKQLRQQSQRRTESVAFSYRVLGNPQLDYLLFFVYGLALVALQQGLLLAVAAGVLWEDVAMPETKLKPGAVWLIKSGIYVVLGLVSYVMFLAVGGRLFALPAAGLWTQHVLLAVAFLFCVTQLGGIAACLAGNELLFSRLSVFYTVPAFMLSGYTWPVEAMPWGVRCLAYLSPFTYWAQAVRSLCLNGYYRDLQFNALVLLCAGLAALPFAVRLFSGKMRQKLFIKKMLR
ncbi:MAG: ABC transporter permease [Phascolarctobacterium sp.]|uniref:ABC transporter permease n=1 Tax=Phascolarctobacterium sp. TaxID=2049039 RepID=UPI0026DAED7A|nr:ABC transporter permease [Phascolarctobacterium sp.]MDO4922379.1 ABC transporter permease [Phascolarctobacterium sp.]